MLIDLRFQPLYVLGTEFPFPGILQGLSTSRDLRNDVAFTLLFSTASGINRALSDRSALSLVEVEPKFVSSSSNTCRTIFCQGSGTCAVYPIIARGALSRDMCPACLSTTLDATGRMRLEPAMEEDDSQRRSFAS